MTVKEKTGRRRYVYIEPGSEIDFRKVLDGIRNSSLLDYRGLKVVRIKHYQLDDLRKLAEKNNMSVRMVSGTLKALHRKVSEVK
ncbi:MAG: hypothetical protein M1515_03335 [Candidatus Thermoplasmatota archaeon]|jgi:hypothetical protein|nr:hypothetical protein [Candidatus Thermoplasmatota archaeon]